MISALGKSPSSICILRFSAIGDVCHAVSSVQAIARHYPLAKVTWIIGKVEYQLVKGLPNIEFIVFDKSLGLSAYSQLRKKLKGRRFDVLLHMQLALRANLAALCVKAKIKIGFPKARCKELHSLAVNQHIDDSRGMHVLEGFRDFARAIGVPDSAPSWDFTVALAQDEISQWVEKTLPKQDFVVISPNASKPERNWCTEKYAAIADYCHSKGMAVVLCGGPSQFELELAANITDYASSPLLNLVGKTQLIQLLACLRGAKFVIAPDSGPAHMATTQTTPVIGLYAHSNPRRTGPYLSLDTVCDVYTEAACQELDCDANELPWGFRLKGADLMQQISLEMVKERVDALLT